MMGDPVGLRLRDVVNLANPTRSANVVQSSSYDDQNTLHRLPVQLPSCFLTLPFLISPHLLQKPRLQPPAATTLAVQLSKG